MPHVSRILACGYFGFANAGDEAILAALLADLRSQYPDATITVLAGDPEAVRADYGVEAVHWQDVDAQLKAAEAADLMVLGGGGLFQEQQEFDPSSVLSPQHGGVSYYAGFALIASMTATPLIIYAVGVGPLLTPEGEHYTRLAFRQAMAATVRDPGSKELLARIGVDTSDIEVTADPAWATPAASTDIVPEILELEHIALDGSTTVVVAARPWPQPGWQEALAATLDRLVDERDARILFVPYQQSPRAHENDTHAALEIVRLMRRPERTSIVRGGYLPEERAALIASADLLIAMRLHAAMAGAIAGVPMVALGYDPKVAAAMSLVGLESQVVDISEVTPESLAERIAAAAGRAEGARLEQIAEVARANRQLFTRPLAPPPDDSEPTELLSGMGIRRIRRQAELESRLTELAKAYDDLVFAHSQLAKSAEEYRVNYQSLLDTRAIRAMNRYWEFRAALRKRFGRAARGGPLPVRRLLGLFRKTAPPAPEPAPKPEPQVEIESVEARLRNRIKGQISEALAAYPDALGVVVYPPSIGWEVSLHQRPQQMASAFARLGYLVFYGLDHVNNEGVVGVRQVGPRLFLLSVPPHVGEALETIPDPIAVSYVYNFAWTKGLKDPRVVFEHIDELEVFTSTHSIDDLREWYRDAIEGAELVVGSARDLVRSAAAERPDAILCPNGVEYRHFAGFAHGPPPEDVADLAAGDHPVIGYYGAIAEWLDWGLIRKAATEMPDFEFVFIGPEYELSVRRHMSVFDLPNVRWLGIKRYADLPAYLQVFDVATIPFIIDEVTHAVSPIKLFEYWAGGKPVVTPALRECAAYEATLIAADADDYLVKLRQAVELSKDPEYRAMLRRVARANTWEMRAGSLVEALARRPR